MTTEAAAMTAGTSSVHGRQRNGMATSLGAGEDRPRNV
jgi:hypothetical protein